MYWITKIKFSVLGHRINTMIQTHRTSDFQIVVELAALGVVFPHSVSPLLHLENVHCPCLRIRIIKAWLLWHWVFGDGLGRRNIRNCLSAVPHFEYRVK